jgi:choline dehydrogenase-like flavoprotein
MARTVFDVCIVGSGPGGGIAAYVLSKAGLKVALVEAGAHLRPGVDYGAHSLLYDDIKRRLERDGSPAPRFKFEMNHFTAVGDRPNHGQLRAVGGRSLCWAGHSLRFGQLDFKRWEIGYDEVAPYYSKAERFMGVYGNRDGLGNMPDGEFLKGLPMRCAESALRRGVKKLQAGGREIEMIALRKAILTEKHASGRPVCHYCGNCMKGCDVDSKYTSANTPIPLGLKTGNLKLFTNAYMTRIVMDQSGRRVAAIEYVNAAGKTERVECRALVLACSAVETARHLLLNKTREFPDGLANSSGMVGKNLVSHFGLWVVGFFPELARRQAANEDGTDYFHSLVTGMYWQRPARDFEGSYQIQNGAGISPYRSLQIKNVAGFGADLKRSLSERNVGHVGMNMQGEMRASAGKFVDLDPARRDRFGLPLPRVHLHYTDNDVAMARDCLATCEEVIHAAGGEIAVRPAQVSAATLIIDGNHWVGTTRMGKDAKTSVVNLSGQTHDIPNLFIGDASVFTNYPEKNPTLTNIALSWRMSERLVEKFRHG